MNTKDHYIDSINVAGLRLSFVRLPQHFSKQQKANPKDRVSPAFKL